MTIKEMYARLRASSAEAKKIPEGEKDKLDALLDEANDLYDKIGGAEARARLSHIADGIVGDGKHGEARSSETRSLCSTKTRSRSRRPLLRVMHRATCRKRSTTFHRSSTA